MKRGEIEFPKRAQQIIDFSGLQFGKITPTDIDGVIEYKDKAYVLIEMKYHNTEIKPGQQLCLERMADDTERSGKKSLLIIADHEVDNPEQRIDAAPCLVRKYYRPTHKWITPKSPVTVLTTITQFLRWVNKEAQ